jgi:general secretion pathway protein I
MYRSTKAFTLIEILAALSILALAVTSLIVVRNKSIDRADQSIELRKLRMLTEWKMGEIMSGLEKKSNGVFPGDLYSGYYWKTETKNITEQGTSLDGNTQSVKMKRVILTVASKKSKEKSQLQGILLLKKPEDGTGEEKNDAEKNKDN